MSKAKDRARAESGTIFRDGSYVNAEEWHKAHPTREMLHQRQAKVDNAVADLMAANKRIDEAKSRQIVVVAERKAAGAPPFDYSCSKCERTHKHGSKVHEAHQIYAKEA